MAERKTYTDLQKAEILKKADETSVSAASKEFGVARKTIANWKAESKVTAGKIEAKKKTRAAGRKVRETVTNTADMVAGDVKDATDKVKLVEEIEAGKVKAKNARKAAEKEEKAAQKEAQKEAEKNEKAARKHSAKARAVKLNMVIQSQDGRSVTTTQIALRLPKETVDAYIKAEENKIYYVLKNGETGCIDIWE